MFQKHRKSTVSSKTPLEREAKSTSEDLPSVKEERNDNPSIFDKEDIKMRLGPHDKQNGRAKAIHENGGLMKGKLYWDTMEGGKGEKDVLVRHSNASGISGLSGWCITWHPEARKTFNEGGKEAGDDGDIFLLGQDSKNSTKFFNNMYNLGDSLFYVFGVSAIGAILGRSGKYPNRSQFPKDTPFPLSEGEDTEVIFTKKDKRDDTQITYDSEQVWHFYNTKEPSNVIAELVVQPTNEELKKIEKNISFQHKLPKGYWGSTTWPGVAFYGLGYLSWGLAMYPYNKFFRKY